MKKRVSFFLALALSLSTLVGCGGGGATTSAGGDAARNTAETSKVVNIAISENGITLDPHATNNQGSEALIVDTVFEPLVMTDNEGNFWPWLATDWEYNEDGTEWTFNLREGVTFNNGDPFTADDVVCSYQRLIDDNGMLARGVLFWPDELLSSVEKLGDYSVKIKLNRTYATALYSFAKTPIIPATVYAAEGDSMFYNQNLVGTGPWVLDEWVDGQYGSYHKNENYWNKENYDSYYDELKIHHVMEKSSGIAGHIAGDLDANLVVGGINPEMISMYDNSLETIEIVEVESFSYYYMGLQCGEDSPFNDIAVRQAFDLAIDRQTIADVIMGGGKALKSIIPEGVIGYDEALPEYEYNPEKAKELLANSSYDGREIVLSSNTSTTKAEDQLQAISGMLNEVGFNTKVEIVENATLQEMRSAGDYDAFLVICMHQGGDPGAAMNLRILNDCHKSNFVDDQMNELIKKASQTMDEEARADYFKQVTARMREMSAPHSALYSPYSRYAVDYGVVGLDLYRDGTIRVAYVDYDENATTFHGPDYEKMTAGL